MLVLGWKDIFNKLVRHSVVGILTGPLKYYYLKFEEFPFLFMQSGCLFKCFKNMASFHVTFLLSQPIPKTNLIISSYQYCCYFGSRVSGIRDSQLFLEKITQ